MKILLYSRPGQARDESDMRKLIGALESAGMKYMLNEGFASEVEKALGVNLGANKRYDTLGGECLRADIALSYGGDGTFLECAKMIGVCSIPILGINSGRLGFLANVSKDGLVEALSDLRDGKYTLRKSSLLEIRHGEDPEPQYAFNELSVQRAGSGMIAVETYVDGEMVATYWGDGVILSTPAGSTAYALSVGGPVVAPRCDCFVLAPIAPHNLTMRPIVLPDNSSVEMRVLSRGEKVTAAADGDNTPIGDGAVVRVQKAEKSVFLVQLQNISFYDTLRNKMLWGLDKRDESEGM